MNNENIKKLQHIIARGSVLREEDQFEMINFSIQLRSLYSGVTSTINSYNDIENVKVVDTQQLNTSDQQLEIEKLKKTITELTFKLDALSNVKTKTRKPHKNNHLSQDEVKEIENIFMDNINTDAGTIANAYGSSKSVIYNIRKATHPKTSHQYKAFFLEGNYTFEKGLK